MGRIRTLKPEIARHEGLFEAEQATGLPLRFAWAVLPTACDKEGRFKWRPRAMKADVLPYDTVDFANVLDTLLDRGFLVKYRVGEDWFGLIPTFRKHQHINNKESDSVLPGIDRADEVISRGARVDDALPGQLCLSPDGREGKGREEEGNGDSSTAPRATEPQSPAFAEYPVVGVNATPYRLSEAQVDEWARLFPGLDVRQELRHALAWAVANPGRRKTAGGMAKFLVGWLTRSNDRGGRRLPTAAAPGSDIDPSAKRSKEKYSGMRFGK